ncbi:protein efr3 [Anaeramoeba ignava]|uniref:Protein efr3 n=1 Tax=Anaeramoeba ignava TaxID=1746090 RepID=A0A9Q0RGH0_ANAIG|nr:protein efr3 [Anaeramoeba ignava]
MNCCGCCKSRSLKKYRRLINSIYPKLETQNYQSENAQKFLAYAKNNTKKLVSISKFLVKKTKFYLKKNQINYVMIGMRIYDELITACNNNVLLFGNHTMTAVELLLKHSNIVLNCRAVKTYTMLASSLGNDINFTFKFESFAKYFARMCLPCYGFEDSKQLKFFPQKNQDVASYYGLIGFQSLFSISQIETFIESQKFLEQAIPPIIAFISSEKQGNDLDQNIYLSLSLKRDKHDLDDLESFDSEFEHRFFQYSDNEEYPDNLLQQAPKVEYLENTANHEDSQDEIQIQISDPLLNKNYGTFQAVIPKEDPTAMSDLAADILSKISAHLNHISIFSLIKPMFEFFDTFSKWNNVSFILNCINTIISTHQEFLDTITYSLLQRMKKQENNSERLGMLLVIDAAFAVLDTSSTLYSNSVQIISDLVECFVQQKTQNQGKQDHQLALQDSLEIDDPSRTSDSFSDSANSQPETNSEIRLSSKHLLSKKSTTNSAILHPFECIQKSALIAIKKFSLKLENPSHKFNSFKFLTSKLNPKNSPNSQHLLLKCCFYCAQFYAHLPIKKTYKLEPFINLSLSSNPTTRVMVQFIFHKMFDRQSHPSPTNKPHEHLTNDTESKATNFWEKSQLPIINQSHYESTENQKENLIDSQKSIKSPKQILKNTNPEKENDIGEMLENITEDQDTLPQNGFDSFQNDFQSDSHLAFWDFYHTFIHKYYETILRSIHHQLLLDSNTPINYKALFKTLGYFLNEFPKKHFKRIFPLFFSLQEKISTRLSQKRITPTNIYCIMTVIIGHLLLISYKFNLLSLSQYILSTIGGIESWNIIDPSLQIILTNGIKIQCAKYTKNNNNNNNNNKEISKIHIPEFSQIKLDKIKIIQIIKESNLFNNNNEKILSFISQQFRSEIQPISFYQSSRSSTKDIQLENVSSLSEKPFSLKLKPSKKSNIKLTDSSLSSEDDYLSFNESEYEIEMKTQKTQFTSSKLKELMEVGDQKLLDNSFELTPNSQNKNYNELVDFLWKSNSDKKSSKLNSLLFSSTKSFSSKLNETKFISDFEI